jgi:Amt family ammonium transporter
MESLQDTSEAAAGDRENESTFLEDLFDSASEAMAIIQRDRILRVNREFVRLFGYPATFCLGTSLAELVVPEGRMHETEMLMHMVEVEGRASMETVRRIHSGHELDVSVVVSRVRLGGGRVGHSVTYRDIHQEKQIQAKLQHTALHDALTGLANRVLFLDRLTLTMARLRRRPDRNFAVVFLDLDRFKQVNDTWGHSAGDTLLLAITSRLRFCLRPQDTVARFGGDEFALVVDEVGCREDMESLAERIQCEMQRPVDVGGGEVCVSASIGIVLGSPAYNDVEEILRDADTAMYRAKENGKARHEFFAPEKPAQAPMETSSPAHNVSEAA